MVLRTENVWDNCGGNAARSQLENIAGIVHYGCAVGIFSQDSKNLVSGMTQGGQRELLRGVPGRLCCLEKTEWKRGQTVGTGRVAGG